MELTAEDIWSVLKKYKLNDNYFTIIGCGKHLYKTLKEDIKKYKKKIYVCYYKHHWFTMIIFFLDKEIISFTCDSLGNELNKEYKKYISKIKKTRFVFNNRQFQTDSYSCGYYSILFVLFLVRYDYIKLENLIERTSITDFSFILNQVQDVFISIIKNKERIY